MKPAARAPASTPAAKRSHLRWFAWLATSFALGAGATLIAVGDPAPPAAVATSSNSERDDERSTVSAHEPRPIKREYLVRPADACQQSDPEGEQRYRSEQSRELLGVLRTRLGLVERLPNAGSPEAVLGALDPYIEGWTDSLVRTGPDLADEIAAELEATMCDSSATPTQLTLRARVIQRMPELGNARGIDCVVARGTEDLPLGPCRLPSRLLVRGQQEARVRRRGQSPQARRRVDERWRALWLTSSGCTTAPALRYCPASRIWQTETRSTSAATRPTRASA
jgi:hypothetical protein